MLNRRDQIIAEVLQMSEEDRAEIGWVLWDSLESPFRTKELDEAWREEIQRRLDEIDHGEAKTVSWEEIRKKIFSRD